MKTVNISEVGRYLDCRGVIALVVEHTSNQWVVTITPAAYLQPRLETALVAAPSIEQVANV